MTLKDYIYKLQNYENDIASHVDYDEGSAYFWYNENRGYYTLVLSREGRHTNSVDPDSMYWGNDDLTEFNDIVLNAEQLYNILIALPGVDTYNFYAMRSVLEDC